MLPFLKTRGGAKSWNHLQTNICVGFTLLFAPGIDAWVLMMISPLLDVLLTWAKITKKVLWFLAVVVPLYNLASCPVLPFYRRDYLSLVCSCCFPADCS